MSTTRRTFLIVNIGLVVLIGAMFWYLATRGETQFVKLPQTSSKSNSGLAAAPAKPPGISTEGMSAEDRKAIEALQAQLEAEKARAQQTRAQIQARQAERAVRPDQAQPGNARPVPAGEGNDALALDEQKQRITRMIEAQLQGVTAENQRLAEELARKNREIEAVRQQNTELAQRLNRLDDSAQSLLATLVADGNKISRSDQDYISAMQALADQTNAPLSATLDNIDLINRVEIADSGDTGGDTVELRSMVDRLMTEPAEAGSATDINNQLGTVASSQQGGDLQASINALMARNDARQQQRQSVSDEAYLESLSPMEDERSNETRWVTVRQGDTLYDIALRVYEDGWLYQRIFDANPQILSNPDRIKPGQRLRVPL